MTDEPQQPNRVDIEDTVEGEDERIWYGGVPYTGETFERDIEGQITAINAFRDGVEEGLQREFFGDGQLRAEYTAVKGAVLGETRDWHLNGQLARYQVFDETGRMLRHEMWDEDGAPVED